jgi:hypothetical protein
MRGYVSVALRAFDSMPTFALFKLFVVIALRSRSSVGARLNGDSSRSFRFKTSL